MIKLVAKLLTLRLLWQGFKARRGEPPRAGSSAADVDRRRAAPVAPRAEGASGSVSDGDDGGGIPVQTGEGAGRGSPLEMGPHDWKQTAKRTLKEIKDDRATLVAAGMAYYGFLALFPALIAAVGVLGLIDAPDAFYDSMQRSARSALPEGASRIVLDAIDTARNSDEETSLTAALLGTLVALWSASSGMVALQKGLNIAYDVDEERKFLKARLVAFALIIAIGLLGGVPSPFFTFGDNAFFTTVGWILTIAALMVLFSLFYYLGPNRDSPRWTWVSPGGVLGATLWLSVSAAFGFYVREFSSYGETYGALAGVVVLILWLFLTSLSVLIGGELNAELERQSSEVSTA